MKYDLIIIGMGISGISSAIYASNSNLKVLLLEKDTPGGLLNKISKITNYPGFKEISGPDLSYNLFDMINDKVDYKIEEVIDIKLNGKEKRIITNKNEYLSNYIIIASGRANARINISGERELLSKGISTCALCDGHLYKNKEIALVGGGNSAIEEALYLSDIVKKIYLIHRRDKFRADSSLVAEIAKKNNIEYLFNSQITSINSEDDKLSSIVINNNKVLKIDGLFTYLGFVPNTTFLDSLNLNNDKGYILVDDNYETNINGIYAVGDCIKKSVYQLITAGNDGAVAATNVIKKINTKK